MVQRKAFLFALFIAILSDAAVIRVLWPQGFAYDFAVFWRTVHGPISQIYADSPDPFVYPPTGLLWFQPLRLAPLWPGYMAWTALSFAAFWFASARLFGPRATWFAAISPAIVLGLIPGQTSLFAGAGLLAAFAIRSPVGRGALLGLVLTLKPQLVLMAPLFLLVKRDFLALAVMSLVVVAITGLATAAFGPSIWAEWIQSMPNFQQVLTDRHLSLSAVSPAGYATEIGVPAPLALAAGVAAGMAIASRANSFGAEKMAAAVAAASLLAAPMRCATTSRL